MRPRLRRVFSPVPVGVAGPRNGGVVVVILGRRQQRAPQKKPPMTPGSARSPAIPPSLRNPFFIGPRSAAERPNSGPSAILRRAGGSGGRVGRPTGRRCEKIAWSPRLQPAGGGVGRFVGLVVIDRGPIRGGPDLNAWCRDEDCPPVKSAPPSLGQLPRPGRTVARNSQRFVYADSTAAGGSSSAAATRRSRPRAVWPAEDSGCAAQHLVAP